MIKLNNKGLGHHLVIIVVAVLAVVGAAGYFVWNGQKDKGIDAKAAGYTYQVATGANMGDGFSGSVAYFLTCSQFVKGKTYTLNVKIESRFNKPIDGYVKVANKNILTLKLNTAGSVLGSKSLSGDTSVLMGDTGGLFTPKTLLVKDMLPCNQTDISNTYNYQYVLWSSGADQAVPDPNSKVAMLACTLLNADGTYALETKLTGTPEYAANSAVQDFNAKKDILNLYRPSTDITPVFGWPRPVVKKGTSLGFYGKYGDVNGQEIKLFGMLYPPTVESIKSCK